MQPMKTCVTRAKVVLSSLCVTGILGCGGGGGDSSTAGTDAGTTNCSGSQQHYSGNSVVDSLISGPSSSWLWNFRASSGGFKYSFEPAVASSAVPDAIAFNDSQRQAATLIFEYIRLVTGIEFVEVSGGESNLRLVNSPDRSRAVFTTWDQSATYIVMTVEPTFFDFHDPRQGTYGYLTLLHEFGHALGLIHPPTLPNATQSIMGSGLVCNTNVDCTNMPTTFGSNDLLALKWIYGGDGFGGEYGYSSRCGSSL